MEWPKFIASCSFGKDSLATILLAKEHGEPLDEAVYCEVMFDNTLHTVGGETLGFSLVFVMAVKGIFQLHHTAIKSEIQIAGDVPVAQSIILLIDFFDVLHKLHLHIRELSALGLDQPIFAQFCNYGHFTHQDAPWEQTNRATSCPLPQLYSRFS